MNHTFATRLNAHRERMTPLEYHTLTIAHEHLLAGRIAAAFAALSELGVTPPDIKTAYTLQATLTATINAILEVPNA